MPLVYVLCPDFQEGHQLIAAKVRAPYRPKAFFTFCATSAT
jgi:hypothetical protein